MREQLAVHIEQRAGVGKAHAGARHHGALEGVAMNVHDAGQYQQVARIESRSRRAGRPGEATAAEREGRRRDAVGGEDAPAAQAGKGGVKCVIGIHAGDLSAGR
ncbi:hypothetical protein OR16_40514 [Cupriavidus basilensis OR16]|uniref:Uncharacterized protein n=1 Tax=Cupriavidus basilensis OR16 TaxID=1127483 RepID=H1SHZ8_9BURK|nr:hypothetical protein OR16_40514 [Cupriavidus basilensis OR16]